MSTYDLADIARGIRDACPHGPPIVVAIDGRSGSGKSKLARRLGRALGEFTLVRMDHLVPGWDGLEESVRLMRPIVHALRGGESTHYRLWDWARGDWGQRLARPAAPHIVLEGCGSGARSLSDLVDYLIWVEAPTQVRHARAIARDGQTYAAHWEHWAAQEKAHFSDNDTRARSDLEIDGRARVR